MGKVNFKSKFSELKRFITSPKYAENKTYKDLVVSFVTGKLFGVTTANKTYYLIGDQSKRFLMHEVVPLAFLTQSGSKINISFNANMGTALDGITRVFSYIQNFYTKNNHLVQDQDDINDFFGTKGIKYDIQVQAEGFSALFGELLNNEGLHNYSVFLEYFNQSKDNPKYKNLYLRYKDIVGSQDQDYELVDIKHSSVKYSGDDALNFVGYRNKFKQQIYDLVSGDVPANLAGKTIEEIKRLTPITVNSSELNAIKNFPGDIFRGINELASSYGISSYYDFIYNLVKNNILSANEFPAKTIYDSMASQLDDQNKQALKAVLTKMSKAFNALTSGDNKELLDMAKSSGMMNFFTYLDTQDIKSILDEINQGKAKNQGLLKEQKGTLSKSLDKIYKFQNALFTKVRNLAYGGLKKGEGLEVLVAKNTTTLLDEINQQAYQSIRELFSDPEILQTLKQTTAIYGDMLSKLATTGGKTGEINPADTTGKFFELAKDYLAGILTNSLSNIYSSNVTETNFQKLLPDILRMHSFTESIGDQELKSKFENGYLWSGSVIGETEITYSITDGIVDLPIGFITYKAHETKKTHLGEGHILRIEIKDNFIRISLPSFYIGVSKTPEATVVRRLLNLETQKNRMGEFVNREITDTLTSKEIHQEAMKSTPANKEIKDLIKGGRTVMYLAKDGDLISFANSLPKDYYNVESITQRGLTLSDLENFYQKLSSDNDMAYKYRKYFLKEDISNAISGYKRWIESTKKRSQDKLDKISTDDPDFFNKRFRSLLAAKTSDKFLEDKTRMVIEMKVGDTGVFNTHSIYQLWSTYTQEEIDDQGNKSTVEKVRRIHSPYFRRETPNPAFVYAFSTVGVSNTAKDKLETLKNHTMLHKEITEKLDEVNKQNGIEYSYSEDKSKNNYIPTVFEGDIVSGYTKVIDTIKENYTQRSGSNILGVGVWVTIDPKVINNEGEEIYRRLIEAQEEIKNKYYTDLVEIVTLLQEIHAKNQQLNAVISNFSAKDNVDLGSVNKKITANFKKEVLDKFKISLQTSIQTRLTEGNTKLESIIKYPTAFEGTENLPAESFNPDKALNQFSDTFIQTLQDIMNSVTNEYTAMNKLKPSEDINMPDFYKRNIDKFTELNNTIRQYSLKLLTMAAGYKLKKGAMMDMIKSGRVQNYLQYEQEAFKGNEPAEGTEEGEE